MDETKIREGWEVAARRTQFSPKVYLVTLPGYWIRARKYPVRGKDELDQIAFRKGRDLPRSVIGAFRKAIKEGITAADYIKNISEDEMMDIVNLSSPEIKSNTEKIEASIRWGLGEHNLEKEEGTIGVSPQLLENIMQYPAEMEEIFKMIEEWNIPLAIATEKK
jgi:hypothetical protein